MAMSPSTGKKKKRIDETTQTSSYDGSVLSELGPPMKAVYSGPFRDNIRRFLKERAEPTKHCSVAGFPTWRSYLVNDTDSVLFSLYIVEEDVRKSDRPHCDNCRCVEGWSHHFVSKRRYHLIIPRERECNKPKISKSSLDLNTHLLHGMIHCNGFGHLLCIDRKDNSTQTEEIMNLWNRICFTLRVRKITVQDLEKKGTMDLRLLHALTYGRSWFAKWGYNFHRSSFGVTQDKYERALQVLSSLELDTIVQDNLQDSTRAREIQTLITTIREAAADNSETSSLVTINDLFQFMLALRNSNAGNKQPQPPQEKNTKFKKRSPDHHKVVAMSSVLNSRWPERRLEHAVKVIANTLKNHKKSGDESMNRSMSRQELRNAVRLYIGDTGLIDFVIKNINDVVVGNLIIHRRLKPKSKTLEFSVEEKKQQQKEEEADSFSRNLTLGQLKVAGLDAAVKSVYDTVVGFGSSESHPVRLATKVILNSKHFIKDWEIRNLQQEVKNGVNHMMCKLMPSYEELLKKLTRPLPPPEIMVVPRSPGLTVEELKLMVQTVLRDTYWVTDQFVVQELLFLDKELVVRGSGLNVQTKLRYEGGFEDWVVDCIGCGARDDDGERMVECDECGVWHHTFCSTIGDDEDVPPMFICGRCNKPKVSTKHTN